MPNAETDDTARVGFAADLIGGDLSDARPPLAIGDVAAREATNGGWRVEDL